MLNIYFLIAAIINLIVLVFFVVALINLMINTRETAENTAKIREFAAELKKYFPNQGELYFTERGAKFMESFFKKFMENPPKFESGGYIGKPEEKEETKP